jgi:polyisoprenoid-binding protein YceI
MSSQGNLFWKRNVPTMFACLGARLVRSKLFIVGGLLALMPLACAPRSEAPGAAQPPTVAEQEIAAGEPVAKTPLSTATVVAPTSTVVPTALATEVAVEPTAMPPAVPASVGRRFKLQPAETVASFSLSEVLYGTPKIVVGTTSEVQGGLLVDFVNPAKTDVDPIEIGAGSFVTDSGRRDGAIRRFILDAANYPLIRFVPQTIAGLPDSVKLGDKLTLSVLGDLTIMDSTRQETFALAVLVSSEQRLEGVATATVLRSNYGLRIPSLPFLADVADEVTLEIRFVAAPE